MAASAESCAHCGKQGVGFQRCSRCKQTSYCGAECQNANWKRHKKTCAPPVTLKDLADAASAAGDWRGVLQREGRMEELMALRSDDDCSGTLKVLSDAHQMAWQATGNKDHLRSYVGLVERQIPLLGSLQRFRDQGEAMCSLSRNLRLLKRNSEAANWIQRARDVGAAHGFFSLESRSCVGLGILASDAGRDDAKRAGGGRAERVGRPLVRAQCPEVINSIALQEKLDRRGGAASSALSRGGQGLFGKGGIMLRGV